MNYYKKEFDYSDGQSNKEKTTYRAKKIIKRLKKIHPNGKSILDIGCGFGTFLLEANKSGLETTGIEPSKNLYSVLVKYLTKTRLFNLDLENFLLINKEKYDFITLNHVLEHFLNPVWTIKRLKSRLNKNGVLFIETPNLNSYLFFAEKENYTFLNPFEHIYLLSLPSIKAIIMEMSLEIISHSTYSYPEHLVGILKKIALQELSKLKPVVNAGLKPASKEKKFNSSLKYLLIDKILAPIFTPVLNWGGYGSILELYIRKIS